MPISGREIVENPDVLKPILTIGNCPVCGKPVTDEHPDEVKMVDCQPAHEDCYYKLEIAWM